MSTLQEEISNEQLSLVESSKKKPVYSEVMINIRERQRKRGHQPPSPREVDEYLQNERAAWG